MFTAGQYAEAEAIYRRLVEKHFELGSTYCHLGRVFLMLGRESEARTEVERAYELRRQWPVYVVARTLFLRLLLQMLEGADWKPTLLELKCTLGNSSAHMVWVIQVVVDHVKSRLPDGGYELLCALAAAIDSRSKLEQLQALPLWKSICDEPTPPATPAPTHAAAAAPVKATPAPTTTASAAQPAVESEKFSFGRVVKVAASVVTVREYCFKQDTDVDVEYHADADTQFGNVEKLADLKPGDDVVLDYLKTNGRCQLLVLVKEVADPTAITPETQPSITT